MRTKEKSVLLEISGKDDDDVPENFFGNRFNEELIKFVGRGFSLIRCGQRPWANLKISNDQGL